VIELANKVIGEGISSLASKHRNRKAGATHAPAPFTPRQPLGRHHPRQMAAMALRYWWQRQ